MGRAARRVAELAEGPVPELAVGLEAEGLEAAGPVPGQVVEPLEAPEAAQALELVLALVQALEAGPLAGRPEGLAAAPAMGRLAESSRFVSGGSSSCPPSRGRGSLQTKPFPLLDPPH